VLSRFSGYSNAINNVDKYDTVVLISGPEPQRTLFEEQMTNTFRSTEEKTLIIQGLPGNDRIDKIAGNIRIIPHLSTELMAMQFKQAKRIICRSGYSTIMDLATLDCIHKAILIPTPGQTEQEYLAHYLQKKTAGSLPTVSVN
jgi:UDP-N-acetylglucosamine:LPS N-acetylglucosamine transferase